MRPTRLLVLLVLVAVPVAGGATAAEVAPPLPWQEAGPIGRMYLQLPFEAPELLPAGEVRVGLQVLYTNSILVDTSPSLSAEIDYESAQVTTSVRYGLSPRVELQAALPVFVNWGGFLDGFISSVEKFFAATSTFRPGRPQGLSIFRLTRPDGTGIDVQGTAAALGDAWGAVKVSLLDGGEGVPAISLHGALKAPTGQPGFGSGTVDLGVGALAAWTQGPVALRLQADVFAPMGTLQGVDLAGRVYGAAQLGVAWQAGEVVSLHAQMSAHLSPVWSDLDLLSGWTFYVVVGATFRIGDAGAIQLGVAENVLTPDRGADFTILLGGHVSF